MQLFPGFLKLVQFSLLLSSQHRADFRERIIDHAVFLFASVCFDGADLRTRVNNERLRLRALLGAQFQTHGYFFKNAGVIAQIKGIICVFRLMPYIIRRLGRGSIFGPRRAVIGVGLMVGSILTATVAKPCGT